MMRFDLHIHSKYSFDSLLDTKKIIKKAVEKNLNGIAITDHNTILGGKEAARENRSPLVVIVGAEIRTEVGDIIGLFLNEEIRSRNSLEMLDEVKSQSGIIVFPHPFKGHKLKTEEANELFKKIDCVELMNSRAPITTGQHLFLNSLGKSFVAGSDAHFPFEISLCQTIIKSDTTDPDQIKKLILSKNKTLFCSRYAPAYLQEFSQFVRHVKLRRYSSLLPQSLALVKTMITNKSYRNNHRSFFASSQIRRVNP